MLGRGSRSVCPRTYVLPSQRLICPLGTETRGQGWARMPAWPWDRGAEAYVDAREPMAGGDDGPAAWGSTALATIGRRRLGPDGLAGPGRLPLSQRGWPAGCWAGGGGKPQAHPAS